MPLTNAIRSAVALLIAAAGLWPVAGALVDARWEAPRQLDVAQEADRTIGTLRSLLPPRVGYCFDVDPRMARLYAPSDLVSERLARRFLAQYALAPTVTVPVLGQPLNGQREPSEEDRAARLAELDTILVGAVPGTRCWDGALGARFRPVLSAVGVVVFQRVGK